MPNKPLEQIYAILDKPQGLAQLKHINRGIERECLRLDSSGALAQTPHPEALGSALCHPYITTDFSESLLEYVTPVFTDIEECLDFLKALHQFTYQHIGDELIWMNSMPCILPGITHIPIAEYGHSNVGKMKHVYRQGLSNRYGSAMQTISGIHYNFSVTDELLQMITGKQPDTDRVSNHYLGLVRNFHRHCWVLLYLYGASPAICKSFLIDNQRHGLNSFDEVSFYGPEATTLRMSDLGYRNVAQSRIKIDLTDVDSYITTLRAATEQPYPDYEKIGVRVDGEYRQLNTNLLQIENEYYTVVRPKQVARSGEKPSVALRERGIAYIEVRCMDINPDSPVGITDDQVRFVDTLLLFCLFDHSPPMSEAEKSEIPENRNRIVRSGRDPELTIINQGVEHKARQAMRELLYALQPIADLLDKAHGHNLHRQALERQHLKVDDTEETPSARSIAEMCDNDESFFEYAHRKTLEHRAELKQPLPDAMTKILTETARQSIQEQQDREAADTCGFDEFLKRYFDETL